MNVLKNHMPLLFINLLMVIFIAGCATTQPTMPPISMPTNIEKAPISAGLIADNKLCAPNAITNEWSGIWAGANKAAPRVNFSNIIIDSIEASLNSLFSSVIRIKSQDSVNGATQDMLISPRAIKTSAACGAWAWSDCTFYINIGISFLDPRGILIFEKTFEGKETSSQGNSLVFRAKGEQRAYNAINKAITSYAENIHRNNEYKFLIDNIAFFHTIGEPRMLKLNGSINESVGYMLLSYAARADDLWLLTNLLNRGFSPNVVYDPDGLRPLHWAALYNRSDAIKLLVDAGGDVNQKDQFGHIPIFYASWNNNKAASESLLAMGSRIDIIDENDKLNSTAILDSFGDYFATIWQKHRAKESYELALETMQRVSTESSKKSAEISESKKWAFLGLVLISAAQSYAQNIEARYQTRSLNQLTALRMANEKGVNYFDALNSINKHSSASYVTPQQPYIKDISGNDQETYYDKLAELANQRIEEIRAKLLALNKANSYEEYRQSQMHKQ